MTGDNIIPTAPDNDTGANLGSADTTSDHRAKIGQILAEILEDLAKSENGKQDAESLREWIKSAAGHGLGMVDDGGQTLLHVAAVGGLSEAAKKLINPFPNLNVQEGRQRTPLFEACLNGHTDIVKLLLDHGADTILTEEDGKTPLYVAAETGNRTIVELLLNKSEQTLNSESEFYKWTPLHIAACHGHSELITYLRDKGSRIDPRDEDGWTPLWTAVYYNEAHSMKALLQRKIEHEDLQLETGDKKGQTPLMEAVRRGFLEGVRLLVKAGAKCDKSESTDTIREDTALHLAVSMNRDEIVKFLLESGANVNARNAKGGLDARDDDGMTPLHVASNADMPNDDEQETSDMTVNAPTDESKSTSEDGRYIRVIKLLLERNADANAVTNDKKTALELATESKHHERLEAIRQYLKELSDGFSQDLLRAASNTERHGVAISILKEQSKQSGISFPNDSEHWSAIEWAAFTKNPDALWLLIASSPKDEGTDRALDCVRNWLKKEDQLAKPTTPARDQKRGKTDGRKRSNITTKLYDTKKGAEEVKLIRDHIDNPPTGIMYNDSQEYTTPSLGKDSPHSLEEYKATIVQFHKQQGRFARIRRSRAVTETIYSEGPMEIMGDVVRILERLGKGDVDQCSPATTFMGAKSQFTWIHLPATNMTWMDDLLQRIMKDEERSSGNFHQAKSFFKDSWIQVPDKFSPSRIMRPRFVWHDTNGDGAQNESSSKKKSVVPDQNESSSKEKSVGPDQNESSSKRKSVVPNQNDSQNKDETVAPSLAAVYMPYFSYAFEYGENDVPEKPLKTPEQSGSKPPKASEPKANSLTPAMQKSINPDEKEKEVKKEVKKEMKKEDEKRKDEKRKEEKSVEEKSVEEKSVEEKSVEEKSVEEKKKEEEKKEEKKKEGKYANKLTEARKRYQALLDDYNDDIVHGSSTLDESYYHFGDDGESQEDKKRRNRSQVVTGSWGHKWRKEQELGSYWPLIRVNQLWMWTIDDKWLISASSHPIDDHENELLDGILDLLEKQGVAGGSGLQPSSAFEMSQFIVDYCVESYERKPGGINEDRPKNSKLEELLSIRQTFSNSINSIARAETDLFEEFSRLTKELTEKSPREKRSKDAQALLDGQLTDATLNAEKLSGKVKDILDELNSLDSTVHYQQDVQRSMKALKSMKKQALQMGMKEGKKDNVPETDLSATYIIKDINRLNSVAKRVHDAVNTTLSLQQSEVANLQARLSLKQADASAQQGRVAMIFTVVTILFLPLSFLTSFFALDVSSFQAPGWAVGIIFSISVAFSVPTVVLAFTWGQSKRSMADLLGLGTRKSLKFNHDKLEEHIGNGGSKPDPRGSGASPQGEYQSRTHSTGPQQTGNGEYNISHGKEPDLEKGHGVNGGLT